MSNQSTLPQSVLDAINEEAENRYPALDLSENAPANSRRNQARFREGAKWGYKKAVKDGREDIVPGVQTPQKLGEDFGTEASRKEMYDMLKSVQSLLENLGVHGIGSWSDEPRLLEILNKNKDLAEKDFVPGDNGSKISTLATLPSEPESQIEPLLSDVKELCKNVGRICTPSKYIHAYPAAFELFWAKNVEMIRKQLSVYINK